MDDRSSEGKTGGRRTRGRAKGDKQGQGKQGERFEDEELGGYKGGGGRFNGFWTERKKSAAGKSKVPIGIVKSSRKK